MRTAGLGSGARQTAPAEWLRPDDRADLVAVDIDVADRRARGNMRGHAVDARVDAARQAVTRGVDRVDERVAFPPPPRRALPAPAEYPPLQNAHMTPRCPGPPPQMPSPTPARPPPPRHSPPPP